MSRTSKATKSIAVLLMMLAASACTPKENAGATDGSVAVGDASATTKAGEAGAAMASATASAAASGAAATATIENDPLPTHSDVAKQVRAEITKANYKTELDKLEKEID